MNRIIATMLVLATMIGCLAVLPMSVFASPDTNTSKDVIEVVPVSTISSIVSELLTQNYASAQDKLDRDENMELYVKSGSYELYANQYSGEVYVKDTRTGQILTSNPYSLDGVNSTFSKQSLSQILLKYSDANDTSTAHEEMTSYTEAAARGQISITAINNGIRVNYTIGDTTKRYVLPASIRADYLLDKVFVPMMEQIEKRIQEFAEENGLTDEWIKNNFDKHMSLSFEEYATTYKSTLYDVTNLLGEEYNTYGNVYAFDGWTTNIDKAYTKFYEDHTKAEQKNLASKKEMSKLFTDFTALNQVYTLISAYNLYGYGTKTFDLDRSTWSLMQERLTDYEYLTLETEVVDGTTYYTNCFFALDDTLTNAQMQYYENIFLSYANNFTIDDVYSCEEEIGVSMSSAVNPIFKIAIEYTLDDTGVDITVPASSIVYDESKYIVNYISVLPYLGSGRVDAGGYIFYPDGSGAIVDFDDFLTTKSTLKSSVYGQDYAYYSVTGKHQEIISMPIFGTVKDETEYYVVSPYTGEHLPCSKAQYDAKEVTLTYTIDKAKNVTAVFPFGNTESEGITYYWNEEGTKKNFNTDSQKDASYPTSVTYTITGEENFGITSTSQNGYLAILEEGASLATLYLSVNPYSNLNDPFSSIYCRYIPRAEDTYDLSDSLESIKTSTEFSVLAERRYLGNYSMKIVMLSDTELSEGVESTTYEASYVGMAKAYQDYLIEEGVLTTISNLQSDLPLYIEVFGVTQTTEKYLSIPVEIDVALTSYEDIISMYEELKGKGISNIKYKMTGYYNGGMNASYPVKLKWEKEAGGKSGLKKLIAYVENEDTGLEIFPNFNLMYLGNLEAFDGIYVKSVAAKSVDNRYAYRKSYNSVHQEYASKGGILVTSTALEKLFDRFSKKYSKLNLDSLSIPYLASDVSSDFNEDEYVSREEALENVIEYIKHIRESGYNHIMSTGGNAYAIEYLDYLLEAPIDSSHYNVTSYTVPLWGMVMHSFIEYAGQPFNEEANKREALLRAIESGSSIYFILSYNNTSILKEDESLSDYYAVNYQISKDTLVEYYTELNELTKDLQSYKIVDHIGLSAERELLSSEIASQKKQLEEEFLQALENETLKATERVKSMMLELIAMKNGTTIDFNLDYTDLTTGAKKTINTFINTYGDLGIFSTHFEETDTTYAKKWNKIRQLVLDNTIKAEYGQSIGIIFDEDAIMEAAEAALFGRELDADFVQTINAYITENSNSDADLVNQVSTVEYTSSYNYFTLSDSTSEDYDDTDSTLSDSSVRMVVYSDGTNTVRIILNYNIFAVDVRIDGVVYNLPKYSYIRMDD